MRARAALAVALAAHPPHPARVRITQLRSDPPFVLRPAHVLAPISLPGWSLLGSATACVSLAAGAAGPLGGDDLGLEVRVGSGAGLVLRSAAATLVLPGPHAQPSCSEVHIRVAAGGRLAYLPGPLIAARGCRHRVLTHVTVEPGARLLVRDELLLGRHGERPGSVHQRLRVTLGGRPLHDQELVIGGELPGWDGAAITGGHRAVGSLLVVDPDLPGRTHPLPAPGEDAAVMPLGESAVLISALADDNLTLRRRLESDRALLTDPPPESGRLS